MRPDDQTDETRRTEAQAWEAFNAAYHAQLPDAERAVGFCLLREAKRGEIARLLARSDEQNRIIEIGLRRTRCHALTS